MTAESLHRAIDTSLANSESLILSDLHTKPIQGLLSGEVFSPHVTAHQAGDLAGFTQYDPLTHTGIRINHRISERFGVPMVRENDRTLLSSLWVLSDMTGERYLQNPGLQTEFEAALQIGACCMMAAAQEDTPSGYIITNGYEIAGNDPNGETVLGYLDKSAELAHNAAHISEARFAAANTKKGRLFRKQATDPQQIPKPTIKLNNLLETAAEYPLIQNSLVIVVSDFRDTVSLGGELPQWIEPLSSIGGIRSGTNNTAIAIEVVNPEDFELSTKTETVVDPVTGKTLVTSEIRDKSMRYTQAMTGWTAEMRNAIKREGIGHVAVSVSDKAMLETLTEQLQRLL